MAKKIADMTREELIAELAVAKRTIRVFKKRLAAHDDKDKDETRVRMAILAERDARRPDLDYGRPY